MSISGFSVKSNGVLLVVSSDFEGISVLKPGIGGLCLASVEDVLLEHTISVSKTISPAWVVLGGH